MRCRACRINPFRTLYDSCSSDQGLSESCRVCYHLSKRLGMAGTGPLQKLCMMGHTPCLKGLTRRPRRALAQSVSGRTEGRSVDPRRRGSMYGRRPDRVGRSAAPGPTVPRWAGLGRGRSVGPTRVGIGRVQAAGSVGRGRIVQNQLCAAFQKKDDLGVLGPSGLVGKRHPTAHWPQQRRKPPVTLR